MRPLIFALTLLLLPSQAFAQDTGMSRTAFTYALAGQAADILTTEIALANGAHEANPLMRHRGVRVPFKLALPLVGKLVTRHEARTNANTIGYIVGTAGFGPAGWNIYVTLKGHE